MRSQVANLVTLARVVLVFPFWLAFGRPGTAPLVVALACALLIELSDLLDGTVARRLGTVSDVGKFLDPAADSFSRLGVFLALATHPPPSSEPWFPPWGVLLLLFRDVGVSFLRQVAASRGLVIAARATGKIKAWFQGVGAWTLLALHAHATLTGSPLAAAREIALATSVVVVVVTLASLVDYSVGIGRALTTPPSSSPKESERASS